MHNLLHAAGNKSQKEDLALSQFGQLVDKDLKSCGLDVVIENIYFICPYYSHSPAAESLDISNTSFPGTNYAVYLKEDS